VTESSIANPVSDYFSQAVIEDPFPLYESLRAEGRAVYVDSLDVWMVPHHAECMEVMRNHDVFNQWDGSELNQMNPDVAVELAEMFGLDPAQADGGMRGLAQSFGFGLQVDTLVTANPPEHTRYRNVTNQAWSAKRTAVDAAPRIREVTNLLIDDFSGKDKVEFMSELAAPLPALVISEILGLPRDDWHKFKEWADVGLTLLGGNLQREQVRAAVEAMMQLTGYLGGEIERRRTEPKEDALTALLHARDREGKGLEQPELLSIALHLLGAGHETTINALGNTLWLILRDQRTLDALLEDRALVGNAVAEALRLEAPVQFLFRQCVADYELSGVKIPAGAKVCVLFASANRDPDVFEAPDEFRLDRSNSRGHVSFGFGIHRCIGEPLSIRELEVAMESVLDRLPGVHLIDGQTYEHNPHPFLRRLRELWIEFDPSATRRVA
jgi:cytochrome P450